PRIALPLKRQHPQAGRTVVRHEVDDPPAIRRNVFQTFLFGRGINNFSIPCGVHLLLKKVALPFSIRGEENPAAVFRPCSVEVLFWIGGESRSASAGQINQPDVAFPCQRVADGYGKLLAVRRKPRAAVIGWLSDYSKSLAHPVKPDQSLLLVRLTL